MIEKISASILLLKLLAKQGFFSSFASLVLLLVLYIRMLVKLKYYNFSIGKILSLKNSLFRIISFHFTTLEIKQLKILQL